MNDRMKHVLSSLHRARLNLEKNSASRPDVHLVVHDLMRDLIEAMGLTQSWDTHPLSTDEIWERAWLYDLVEGLTDTCFKLSESPPDEVTMALRTRLDRAIEGGQRPSPPMHA